MTTDLTEQDVIMGRGEKRLFHAIKQAIDDLFAGGGLRLQHLRHRP